MEIHSHVQKCRTNKNILQFGQISIFGILSSFCHSAVCASYNMSIPRQDARHFNNAFQMSNWYGAEEIQFYMFQWQTLYINRSNKGKMNSIMKQMIAYLWKECGILTLVKMITTKQNWNWWLKQFWCSLTLYWEETQTNQYFSFYAEKEQQTNIKSIK